MVVIRIQELAVSEQQTRAMVSFDHGVQYTISVCDPFANNQAQEGDLEWYFEEYLRFPFTQGVRAQKAAKSIQSYGESLFTQVFADPDALAAYKQARRQGLPTLQIEIAGSSAFHRLHWEALYDPELRVSLSLYVSLVRKNVAPQTYPATVRPSPMLRVLVVVARPGGGRDVGYRTISRPLVEEVERTQLPIDVTLLRPGTYQALSKHLELVTRAHGVGYYHLIHFDVHGALLDHAQLEQGAQTNRILYAGRYGRSALTSYEGEKAYLFLEGEQEDQADPVEASELAQLLLQHQVPMVLLNGCQSGKASAETESTLGSRLIEAGVQTVLAMGYSVTVSAAELLMKTLYQELFTRKPLPDALCLARQELANQKERRAFFNQRIELEDWLLPILYQNQPVQFALRPFTPEESVTFYQSKANSYSASQQPSYGFVGRDLDILHVEKRVLTRRNMLLIRGMGGAGKTTLLHHLASWWQRTGLVQEVFYFGYDERAWNRQQIMHSIARKLLNKYELLTFQSLSLDAQQVRLAQLLKSTRYLLILDNLEAITGSKLTVQHTLSRKEQKALRLLLAALVGGQTLVLLGSRSAEEWLAGGTFEENRYELAGLDQEAASQLAESVLERQGTQEYRRDPKLQELLKLLDGFPLAIEVVLANLARQTPAEVIAALQEGDTDLPVGTSEKRTENILQCIDYSFCNLSSDSQQLLLCLAPFTFAVRQDMLDTYAEELKKQPAFASLPLEKWRDVVQETEKWGLLVPDADMPLFLHIQPILPYFLQSRLRALDQQEHRTAIEAAFRLFYTQIGYAIYQLLISKDPQEKLVGQLLGRFEYENLLIALRLTLIAQESIFGLYNVLNEYLMLIQNVQKCLDLGKLTWENLQNYPSEKQDGRLGFEMINIMDSMAHAYLLLKQYKQAKQIYRQMLAFSDKITFLKKPSRKKLRAPIYHQLGMVAQEQRQWEQAERYYQQALQIKNEFKDRYAQGITYHQLGMVAEEQRQWEQAEKHFLEALRIFTANDDSHSYAVVFSSLARLWPERKETDLVECVAAIKGGTPEDIAALFQQLEESSSEQNKE